MPRRFAQDSMQLVRIKTIHAAFASTIHIRLLKVRMYCGAEPVSGVSALPPEIPWELVQHELTAHKAPPSIQAALFPM
jgi:hypothetical protein